ncbi:MAG: PH domain-containing protein [Peptostreptococcaceae bacterium]|nr:PH domain-containing protein [Peptostreptococcaceae bacterium]
MTREKFRCHPSIIIENLGAAFIGLVLVMINGFAGIGSVLSGIESIPAKGVIISFVGGFLILGGIVFWQYKIWYKTLISITDGTIEIERNTINRKHKSYGIKNISNVNLEQNIFEQILRTYKIKIDTDSLSTSNATDIKIVLGKDKALAFKAEVMKLVAQNKNITEEDEQEMQYATTKDYDISYSVKDIIMHSLYALPLSSILSVALLVGVALVFFGAIDTDENIMEIVVKSFGGMLALFLALSTSAARGVLSFLTFFNFRAKRFKNKLIISQGLIKKRTYEIPIDRINAIKIIEPAISRVFNKQSIELVNVGAGDEKDEGAFLLLSKTKEDIDKFMEILLPEFVTNTDENLEKQPKAARMIILIRQLVYIVPLTIALITAIMLKEYTHLALYIPVLVYTVLMAFFMFSALIQFKTAGVNVGNDYIAIASGTYKKVTKLIKYDKIQYLRANQSPLERLKNLQRYKLFILANSVNNVNVTGIFHKDKFNDIYERM